MCQYNVRQDMRRIRRHCEVMFVFVVALLSPVHARSDSIDWHAGAATVKITPAAPMWMAGYSSRNKPASGMFTDLWAKALVLRDAHKQYGVLITLDLIGIDRALSQSICQRLSDEYGFSRDEIAICTSHTHTGPVVGKNLWSMHWALLDASSQQQVRNYADQLEQSVVQVVGEALARMEPAVLQSGHDRATFAVNRRNNPEAEVPARRAAETLVGPVDHDVPVLLVRRQNGDLAAVVFGYACHATVLSDYIWSGDYPGCAQQRLEQDLPGTVAMFWAGCGADQNPLPRRTVELAREYGDALAAAVLRVVRSPNHQSVSSRLTVDYREIDLQLDNLPTAADLLRDSSDSNPYIAMRAKMLLAQIESGEPLATTYPYPISIWHLGESIDWLHLGGEVVVDYAMRIKAERPGRDTWVAAYSHDVMAYIPSRRVWHEGGYEGATAMIYYGLPTRWSESAEEQIVQAIEELR